MPRTSLYDQHMEASLETPVPTLERTQAAVRDRAVSDANVLRQENAELREALGGTLRLLRKAQDVLTQYLHPNSYDDLECCNLLLELLDGPEQRAIETPARALLAKRPK